MIILVLTGAILAGAILDKCLAKPKHETPTKNLHKRKSKSNSDIKNMIGKSHYHNNNYKLKDEEVVLLDEEAIKEEELNK